MINKYNVKKMKRTYSILFLLGIALVIVGYFEDMIFITSLNGMFIALCSWFILRIIKNYEKNYM